MVKKRKPARRFFEGAALRGEDQAREALPVSGDGEWTMPASRRTQHRAENGSGNRAHSAGCYQTRVLFEGGNRGTAAGARGDKGNKGVAQNHDVARTPVAHSVHTSSLTNWQGVMRFAILCRMPK